METELEIADDPERFLWDDGDIVITDRKHYPGQHDQRDHGRRGHAVDLPANTIEVRNAFLRGAQNFSTEVAKHGGPLTLPLDPYEMYQGMNVQEARPEDVPPEQRARCEKLAADFLTNPKMQPYFEAYGKPEVVIAAGLCRSDQYAGHAPKELGVMAQWSNGTIFLYGDTVGDPQFAADNPVEPGWSAWGEPEGIITHEYGHQIWNAIAWDQHADESEVRLKFIDALFSDPNPGRDDLYARILGADPVRANVEQFSKYAAESPDETMAEAFALVMRPDFDIDNYKGGARLALQILLDRLDQDVKDRT